ncbi:hypothetical protein NPIL_413151 [Nephila pilipes]|uniref:Uncharacterized protein n=1 Tax=Nephila pilipes TaxID=299642 RepID=A0A8X6NK49_NEPPI|nr:hypothetical protein NPIL_413151 [Nephila pilipes]
MGKKTHWTMGKNKLKSLSSISSCTTSIRGCLQVHAKEISPLLSYIWREVTPPLQKNLPYLTPAHSPPNQWPPGLRRTCRVAPNGTARYPLLQPSIVFALPSSESDDNAGGL